MLKQFGRRERPYPARNKISNLRESSDQDFGARLRPASGGNP